MRKKFYTVRLDDNEEELLDEFAKTTNRTKAQAIHAAIQITYKLFVENKTSEREKE